MRLNPQDKLCLEELYLHHAIPTDQLRRNPVVLGRIAAAFRRLSGRDEETSELLRYMINRRKNKDWPRLGERARRFPAALKELLDGDIGTLSAIYIEINVPLDEYLLRENLPQQLANAFTTRTGRFLHASTLVAAMMAHRKRGLLPCLEEEKILAATKAAPFSDIELVHRQHRNVASG